MHRYILKQIERAAVYNIILSYPLKKSTPNWGIHGNEVLSVKEDILNQAGQDNIDIVLQEAFGFSDEQLIVEYDRAAEKLLTDVAFGSPKDEFEQIMGRVAARMTETNVAEAEELEVITEVPEVVVVERTTEADRKRRIASIEKWMWRVLIAAALGTAVFGPGMAVSGTKEYEYTTDARDGTADVINNVENLEVEVTLDEQYARIRDELGIHVLELGYIPEGMRFDSVNIASQGIARMIFVYQDKYVYFDQIIKAEDSSVSYISDKKNYQQIYNEGLDIEIVIYKNELGDNKFEFSAQMADNKVYYKLSAIMEEDEFIKIVEGLNFWGE